MDSLKQEMADLQKKIEENEKKIESIKGDKAKQQEYVDSLNIQLESIGAQINLAQQALYGLNDQIETLEREIAELNKSMADIEANIAGTDQKITDAYELLALRMRSAYMTGDISELNVLLGSSDVASFLMSTELLHRAAKRDNDTINELRALIDSLKTLREDLEKQKETANQKRAELVVNRDDAATKKRELDGKRDELNTKKQSLNSYISSLDKQSSTYKNQIQKYEDAFEQADAMLDAMMANGGKLPEQPAANGKLAIPTPLDNYVSSPYGYRYHPISGSYKMHRGMDICNAAGSCYRHQAVAAESGVVYYIGWDAYGYGNYVILRHESVGLYTLYAHLDSVSVRSGQKVTRGETVVGLIGTTGASTGYHLHFEVRTGSGTSSETKQPLKYLPSGYYKGNLYSEYGE
jgi:murein DD-endopeptidase MepM/ murein hydrolase activator NlpD